MKTPLVLVGWLAAIVAANLLTTHNPQWAPINAFVFIGADLVGRDVLDDAWRGRRYHLLRMAGLIVTGSLISYALNTDASTVAIASAIAFAAAFTADWLVYSALLDRDFETRANASNVAGAAVDSVLFPLLAFPAIPGHLFGLDWFLVGTLFGMKLGGGAFFAWILARRSQPVTLRAVPER
jgi:hypothetical protein